MPVVRNGPHGIIRAHYSVEQLGAFLDTAMSDVRITPISHFRKYFLTDAAAIRTEDVNNIFDRYKTCAPEEVEARTELCEQWVMYRDNYKSMLASYVEQKLHERCLMELARTTIKKETTEEKSDGSTKTTIEVFDTRISSGLMKTTTDLIARLEGRNQIEDQQNQVIGIEWGGITTQSMYDAADQLPAIVRVDEHWEKEQEQEQQAEVIE